eukprot:TCALIF_12377-PA protein Name:"Protein of unknown function" AED:0.16 eAED:0.22 QI:6/0.5/0.66/1/1/1/3/14/157
MQFAPLLILFGISGALSSPPNRDFVIYPYVGILSEASRDSKSPFCTEFFEHTLERNQGKLNYRRKGCEWNMRATCTGFKDPFKTVILGKSSDMEVCLETCKPHISSGVNYSWFDETTGECFCLKSCPRVGSMHGREDVITSGIAVMTPEDPDNVCYE